MRFLWSAIFIAAVTGWELRLPEENNRHKFRQDPAIFSQRWGVATLLDGSKINLTTHRTSDRVVHSTATSAPSWVDVLYPFNWELEAEIWDTSAFVRRWWWVSYATSAAYILLVWVGETWMRDRKPFHLKTPLALWNIFLAVFSFIGALRMTPHLFLSLWEWGFDYTLCRAAFASYGLGASGIWAAAFVFSKYFELIDTVFLVLRKREVGFLHWYHHTTVLMYCWHSYAWEMPTGIYFIVMNYCVHAVMYFYYFLTAIGYRPKWSMFVTCIQLLQMFAGVGITVYHTVSVLQERVPNCDVYMPNLMAAIGMYASYLYLFAKFFVDRYLSKRTFASSLYLFAKFFADRYWSQSTAQTKKIK